jgi:antitoxin PrlF
MIRQVVHMGEIVTTSRSVTSRINENGRVVIPAVIRRQMGLQAGDAVVMEVQDGVLRIEPHRARIRRIQESLGRLIPPGRCLSDELIADRREEARREMEEGLG